MEKEKLNNQTKTHKYSFTTISDYFLDEWSGVVGVGPTSLYIHLLKYCYKEKNLAWPTLKTLSKKMGVSERTLIRYRKTLVKYGFIQNIFKRNSTSRNNIYQMTLGKDLTDSKILSLMVTKCKFDGDKMSSCKVTKCHPNNNNLNNNNITTTKRENAVVDFNKLKEKGEERVQSTREQLAELAFEEKFIEQLIKDFSPAKIEEKLDLLKFRRNIQNPTGWLRAALKYDYQDGQQEDILTQDSSIPEGRGSIHRARKETGRINPSPTKNINTPEQASRPSTENKKILSREEALKQIRLARQRLAAITPSYQMEGKW
ncbi:MAG: helix-turn-helix domain-containing protein [Candidatus Atribacteria bacterium]